MVRGFSYADPRVRKLTHESTAGLDTLMVAPLCGLLAEEDSLSSVGAKKALFEIVAAASAPDAPASVRSSVVKTLQTQSAEIKSEIVRNHLAWLLGML